MHYIYCNAMVLDKPTKKLWQAAGFYYCLVLVQRHNAGRIEPKSSMKQVYLYKSFQPSILAPFQRTLGHTQYAM